MREALVADNGPAPAAVAGAGAPVRSGRGLLALAVLLQAALVGSAFARLLGAPGQWLIVDHYDGIKSYFSLATYLRQPLGQGLWLDHGQNYPFGEYIFYTDIAPLLSVPLHALLRAVPGLAPYGLYLFDVFFLLGLVLSTGLLLSIWRRLGVPAGLALLLSLTLPWLAPQTYRLNVGHLALSYTPAVLGPLWLLQGLHRAWWAGRPTGRWWVGLGLAVGAAAWLHFYYLGVLGAWLAFFFLLWTLRAARAGRPWRGLAARAGALLGAVALGTFGVLQALDGYRALRPVGSGGYDWLEWKFQLGALLKGHEAYRIRFLVERTAPVPYESTAYLGAFVLYGLLAVAALAWVQRRRARRAGVAEAATAPLLPAWPPAPDPGREFLTLLLLASLPLALAALGETIELDQGAYVVHNYLNPFFWVHKLTERITQFRALGRFIWPFWWVLVLGFGLYAGRAWQQARAAGQWGLLALWAGLAGLSLVDALNMRHHLAHVCQQPNLLSAEAVQAAARPLLGWDVDPGRYQALLSLPFYHSGSEGEPDQPFVGVDPDDPHAKRSYQLALATGLPLLNHKATRTPGAQARALQSLFRPEGPDPALLARFDARPVLVYLDTSYYAGANANNFYREQLRERPAVRALFERAPAFLREQPLRRLRGQGPYALYEWQPRQPPPPKP